MDTDHEVNAELFLSIFKELIRSLPESLSHIETKWKLNSYAQGRRGHPETQDMEVRIKDKHSSTDVSGRYRHSVKSGSLNPWNIRALKKRFL